MRYPEATMTNDEPEVLEIFDIAVVVIVNLAQIDRWDVTQWMYALFEQLVNNAWTK